MTQPPPPPPNQPPQQGGSDTPQDPRPAPGGGFGPPPPQQPAPQPPQAPAPPSGPPQQPPGYGYPQAPQQPNPYAQQPPAAPGYGQQPPAAPAYGQQPPPPNPYGQPPGQNPNPYGQQYPYGQQPPGHGYNQPSLAHPAAGPGKGGGSRTSMYIVVAAVVAIALIVGGGLWYSSSKDDSPQVSSAGPTGGGSTGDDKGGTGGTASGGTEKAPSDPAAKPLFTVPMPAVSDDDTVTVSGSWLTDKVYAKSGVAEIVGRDPDSGAQLWTVKLPGPVCEASRQASSAGLTAILYEPAMPTKAKPSHGCTEVSAIDLNAGKKLWTKNVTNGDQVVNLDNVTVSASTVAVGSTSGGAAFDLTTGKALWAPKPADTCYDAGYGGGAKLVAVRKCGPYDQRVLHIQTIDPKSGKVISEWQMPGGIEYASVVSTDPLVVAADVGDSAGDGSGISDFFSVDNATGKLLARISAPGDDYAARCDGITRIEECSGLAVGKDRLYVPTEEHDGKAKYSQTNEVVAFDLATGKETGQRADAGDGYTITPLRMDGANLIAYKKPPYDKGGQIVSIDGGTFKQTKLLENPATGESHDAESTMLPDYAEILYSQGHLYMSAVFAHKPSSADQKEYLAIAFGTGA
ncbi:PQQ-binding-like beta-propeller repeat protein [Streptomyces sp. NPDC008150]|uniref:outer membrane protein assembly factor BamB family protein n=1 Tax=Streptomyces sp. NPDC008150 TaxID=3364816 RepID=UPI0036E0F134